MMNWYGNSGSQSWIAMSLMILGWVALLGVAVWAIARFTRTDHHASGPIESPRTILDRRFASGELTADQYAEARRTLEGHPTPAPSA
jgi:putative membrane protein